MQHHHVARGPQACVFVSKTARFLFVLFYFSFPFALVFLVSPPPEGVKYRPDHERLEHRLTRTINGDWLHKHRTNEDCVDSVLYYSCLCEEAFRLPSCVGPWSTLSKVSLVPWWGTCCSQMKKRVLILSLHLHCCCSSSPTFATSSPRPLTSPQLKHQPDDKKRL